MTELDWIEDFKLLVHKRLITIFRFSESEWEGLLESKNGISEFTIARSHSKLESTPKRSICLLIGTESGEQFVYIGAVSSKSAISTLETRIKIRAVTAVEPSSYSGFYSALSSQFDKSRLQEQFANKSAVVRLSKSVAVDVAEFLLSDPANHKAIQSAFSVTSVFGRKAENKALQNDAVRTALKVFDLGIEAEAKILEISDREETALSQVRILEDAVIEHDARTVPGLQFQSSDVTGRAVFVSGKERLEVITANKRPLEQVFGVDLIYFNKVKRSVVMVQYKMLDRENKGDTKWIYRPDQQLESEIERMHRFTNENPGETDSYRLNSGAFYLKFVKRDREEGTRGIVLPLDHFEGFIRSSSAIGAGGGIRIEYDSLKGQYLRNTAFSELVRSGYIGTYPSESEALMAFIELTLQEGRSVVAAIQSAGDLVE